MESLFDEVISALNNKHNFDNFWREDKPDNSSTWLGAFKKSNRRAFIALKRDETPVILSILFQRIYVLRNQMFHGSATWQGTVNRSQVIDCQKLIANITPLFIEIMLRYPEKDWGKLQVPSKPR